MFRRVTVAVTAIILLSTVAHAEFTPESQAVRDSLAEPTYAPLRTDESPSGLTRDWFARLGASLIFPRDGATARAIQRMARGEVSSIPNRCAGTMREALGWGLGDAHRWTSLPSRGFTMRPPGTPAKPGDIVVWPFTFGSRSSQHVGFAVGTDSGMRMLSNLSGRLGLSGLLPGYRAYFK